MTQEVVIPSYLDICEREPIHLPGAVQPHGVLLVLNPGWIVQQISANSQEYLGISPLASLGRPLTQVFSMRFVDQWQTLFEQIAEGPPMPVGVCSVGVNNALMEVMLHRQTDTILLELEPAVPPRADETPLLSRLGALMPRVLQTATPAELCVVTCQMLRQLTGYDRTMVYRFDEMGHGEVIAEEREPEMEPYLGLHYPATDIPQRARELYLLNPVRMIPDCAAPPARLLTLPESALPPVDLTYCDLRALSPVHIEYLHNMGVRASLGMSVICHGRLWGMLVGHHRTPRYCIRELRSACALLAQVFAARLMALESLAQAREQQAQWQRQQSLATALTHAPEWQTALLDQAPALLELLPARGMALVQGETMQHVGVVPSQAEVNTLLAWLIQTNQRPVFCTDSLAQHERRFADLTAVASGVLALELNREEAIYVLWFRAEQPHEVDWGGDPSHPVEENVGTGLLSPRRSFVRWRQVVREKSAPWSAATLLFARLLRSSLVDALHQAQTRQRVEQERRTQQALRDAERLASIGTLAAGIAHEINNPVGSILIAAEWALQRLEEANATAEVNRSLGEIMALAERCGRIVQSVLRFARHETSYPVSCDLNEVIRAGVDLTRKQGVEANVDVVFHPHRGLPRVWVDPIEISMVVANLIQNAMQAGARQIRIVTSAEETLDDTLRFCVEDDGRGITPEDLSHLFDPFFTTRRAEGGTGLGLSMVHGIVVGCGGAISVTSGSGQGTVVKVDLPLSRPTGRSEVHHEGPGGR